MPGRPSRSNKRGDSKRKDRSGSRKGRKHSHRISSGRRRDSSSSSCHDSPRRHRRRDSSHNYRDSPRTQALDTILGRLHAIEDRLSSASTTTLEPPRPARECHTPSQPIATDKPTVSSEPNCDKTDKIVSALSLLLQAKPSHYYISNFDPNVHDFDVWCAEVDRGRELNRWDDHECLSRIGGCLKGDARTWLNDWVSHDRTWSNFKLEFRSLCPRNVDVANILFDTMSTNSNNFVTYAEYARKSLLRLNIVNGLSDDLKTAIVIRGITDPQVKAAASNAKLHPNQLVEFLSVYLKPKSDSRITRNFVRPENVGGFQNRKRQASKPDIKCFNCNGVGHMRASCPKKQKTECHKPSAVSTGINKTSLSCTYCSKVGHTVDKCFAKQRVETKGSSTGNVNFCQTLPETQMS